MNKRWIPIPTEFTNNVILLIKSIPKGKVLTYGRIAKLAGNPRAARQVAWTLNSSTEKYNLPWHRVINSKGIIALNSEEGRNQQKYMLMKEGVEFSDEYKTDLNKYLWKINSLEDIGKYRMNKNGWLTKSFLFQNIFSYSLCVFYHSIAIILVTSQQKRVDPK